jgi:hypothetical protein
MNKTFFESIEDDNLKANYNDFVLKLRRKFTDILSGDQLESSIREIIDQVFADSLKNPEAFDQDVAEDEIFALADELIEAEREAFLESKRT